ncbi:MAG: metallophosphoesterase, partial [Nanoarchaeota archaeon]
FKSFQKAIESCISEKVEFALISGDLFDSAYPPIEILKGTFAELRKLKDASIPCYIIAGSHDFSASGKTFLDVLEKAGFCKNTFLPEIRGENILLNPVIEGSAAIYGYPGKKAGMEVSELRKVKLQDAPGYFKIFMLHTSLKEAVGNLPIEAISEAELPSADYYALGHLHIIYQNNRFVYSSPTFPNNFLELEELKNGGFCIVDTNPFSIKRIALKIKPVLPCSIQLSNSLTATETIVSELKERALSDSVVLLRLIGSLSQGKISDINFKAIELILKERGAFAFLKSTSDLFSENPEVSFEADSMESMETQIISSFSEKNSGDSQKFNHLLPSLFHALSIDKQEDEKSSVFLDRLMSELKKTFNIN